MTDQPTATLHWLPLAQLHPHPDNPRLALNDEVVAGIAAQLTERGTFSPEYALLVRPYHDQYQIIAGHHRREAAQRANLTEVPCWVREMSDDQAYMELGLGNTQGELTPLEVGLHALGAVELGKGGRGMEGGVREYARRSGRGKSTLARLVAAARVYHACCKTVPCGDSFATQTRHLSEIARAPQEHWTLLVSRLAAEDWTVETTREAVEEVLAIAISADELLALKRAVRVRGGEYHGNRQVNGLITRHLVTFPGQPQFSYTTAGLREVLPAFPEQEERLPDDLAAAWALEEGDDAQLIARHQATGVAVTPGSLAAVTRQADNAHATLERLHGEGWTFERVEGVWIALHPTCGRAQQAEVGMLLWDCNLRGDLYREERARALIDEGQWDAAEQVILTMVDRRRQDPVMAMWQRAYRAWLAEQARERDAQQPPAPAPAPPAPAPRPVPPPAQPAPQREPAPPAPAAAAPSAPAAAPLPAAEPAAPASELTPGEIKNLWRCLHGETLWLRQARASVQRLAAERRIALPVAQCSRNGDNMHGDDPTSGSRLG